MCDSTYNKDIIVQTTDKLIKSRSSLVNIFLSLSLFFSSRKRALPSVIITIVAWRFNRRHAASLSHTRQSLSYGRNVNLAPLRSMNIPRLRLYRIRPRNLRWVNDSFFFSPSTALRVKVKLKMLASATWRE